MKMMTITKLVFQNTIEGNTIIFTLHSWDVIAEDIEPRPGQAKIQICICIWSSYVVVCPCSIFFH